MGRQRGGLRSEDLPFAATARSYFETMGYSAAQVAEAMEIYAEDCAEYGVPRSEAAARGAASLATCTMLARRKMEARDGA